MDHAIGGASGATLEEPRQRPGWWWTIGCLLLASILSIPIVALVIWPLSALHVIPSDLGDPGSWPWPRTSAWATAAGLGPLLLVGFGFAYATRFVVARNTEWEVRLWPIALLFVLAATLPVGASEQGDRNGFWLLLLIVVRQGAITREPLSRRLPRPAWLGFGAAALLLALVTVSYQPLHPLSVESTWDSSGNGHPARSLPFTLAVDGAAGVRILSVSAPSDGLGPVSYVMQLDGRRTLDRHLPQGASVSGSIEISPAYCRRGSASVRPETLLVRMRVLGRERTQRLALDAANNISCPRRR